MLFLSLWLVPLSLHCCLNTAGCCLLCLFARWVFCSLCWGFDSVVVALWLFDSGLFTSGFA